MSKRNGNGAVDLTPASEYRTMREQGVPQTLLSGRKVKMRAVTPDKLLRSGRVPDILTPLVVKMLKGEAQNEEIDDFYGKERDEVKDWLAMIDSVNVVCEAALVYPRVVEQPEGDDEIAIDDLSLQDRFWIFKLAFQPAEVLSRFRLESLADVDDSADSEGNEQPTE